MYRFQILEKRKIKHKISGKRGGIITEKEEKTKSKNNNNNNNEEGGEGYTRPSTVVRFFSLLFKFSFLILISLCNGFLVVCLFDK